MTTLTKQQLLARVAELEAQVQVQVQPKTENVSRAYKAGAALNKATTATAATVGATLKNVFQFAGDKAKVGAAVVSGNVSDFAKGVAGK